MQRNDDKLISLKCDLKKYNALLEKEAKSYFATIQLKTLNKERLIAYNVFYHAYLELLEQLNSSEALVEDKKSDDQKKAILTAAIEITLDTITLFKEVSSITDDVIYDPVKDRLNKINAIDQYQKKYQPGTDSASASDDKKFSHAALSVAAGAMGFLLGVGIAVGFGFAIASANPLVLIGVIGIGGWFLGIIGTIVGFKVPSWCHWIPDSKSQTSLDKKAISLANHAATFFSSSLKQSNTRENDLNYSNELTSLATNMRDSKSLPQ